ncbi:MAG TPA: TetR/AcrR family transcriptional regulator [Lapillicoccus sp.]|nr:TetR/AcrR family transcriptional regulator [Lapillicoccus sp.]
MERQGRHYVLRARATAVEQRRQRILAVAADALFTLPFDDLTLPLVAARAGVSTQTVRNHVESKEGLLRAVGDYLSERQRTSREAAAGLDSAGVARMLVREYETYGRAMTRLWAALERSPALSELAQRGRREHRAWLGTTFKDRLPTQARLREHRLAALYAATDVGTWRLLRLDLGHSERMTTDVMRTLIDGALTSS